MGLTRDELWKLRLKDARHGIKAAVAERVYTTQGIEKLLAEHRAAWRFPSTLTVELFTDYLLRTKLLKRVLFTLVDQASAGSYPKEIVLYGKLDATVMECAVHWRSGSYLSHLSAAVLHGITNLIPSVVYANREQASKAERPVAPVQQAAVDRVFSRPPRKSNMVYHCEGLEIVMLAGQNTGGLDIEEDLAPDGRAHRMTSLERTLIDCTVRPAYAGGIHQVLQMFEAARPNVSVGRLHRVLNELGYAYPYRQSIGFLLERAGYPSQRLEGFRTPKFEIDFYIDYEIPSPAYSKEWRLYYPEGL